MFVKLPGPRHTVSEEGANFVIRIPAKRNWFIVCFLLFWLCGWAAGEIAVFASLFFHQGKAPEPFLIIWLLGWTIGGSLALFFVLWQLGGREVITISPVALVLQRELFGRALPRTRDYDLAAVCNVRLSPMAYNPMDFRSGLAFWGIGSGWIAFDYGAGTFRFGAGVDEAEARTILEEIGNRLPDSN